MRWSAGQFRNNSDSFIPAGNGPDASLLAFGGCREGQMPRSLLRCKVAATSACHGGFDSRGVFGGNNPGRVYLQRSPPWTRSRAALCSLRGMYDNWSFWNTILLRYHFIS